MGVGMSGKDAWPRLSETLAYHPVDILVDPHEHRCQNCGITGELGADLVGWQEHDWADRPEPILIVLCRPCGEEIIEPHPRLYRPLARNEPWPGAMKLCTDCSWRTGIQCLHPDLKANGGPGLGIMSPEPQRIHVLTQDKRGRRSGHWKLAWPAPATSCAGWEE